MVIIIQDVLEQVLRAVQVVVECQEPVVALLLEEMEMIHQQLPHKVIQEDHFNTHHLIDKVVVEEVQCVLELLELVVLLKQEETEQDYQQGFVLMVFLVVLLDITLAVVQEDQEL